MSLKIAVIGNTGMNIGAAIAGDMALAGHDVRFLLWPDQLECLEACRAAGGIHVGEPASKTISGKTGLAAIPVITDDPAEAIAGADLVVVNEVQLNLEARAADFIPHLENGQVLHVNMHGYWPGFRLAAMLREADKAGVTVTEGVTPTHAGRENRCSHHARIYTPRASTGRFSGQSQRNCVGPSCGNQNPSSPAGT